MIINHSPWLSQLKFARRSQQLAGDQQTEITIVGGGIAGITTAYYIVTRTNKSVTLVEADKLAHGATGHNAGQVTSYFERHFVELVEEFGLEKAAAGQAAIEGAWGLLEAIIKEANLTTPLYQFIGYAGFSTLDQIMFRLEEESLRQQSGLPPHEFLIKNDPFILLRIPEEFSELYTVVEEDELLEKLETTDRSYIGLRGTKKGCLNSAAFCEQLIEYLETSYADRFGIFEHTLVNTVRLGSASVTVETLKGIITCEQVILCTNGFEKINLINENGLDINGRFHEHVTGTIGYMAGYLESGQHLPMAISYFEPQHLSGLDPYMYLTRRPEVVDSSNFTNLLCVGGPEVTLDQKDLYNRDTHHYPLQAQAVIENFLRKTYYRGKEKITFDFLWHGLMGYTKNGVRLIGFEPCNQRLLYNLGCNGVGILPSIYGGFHISRLINEEVVEPSIFDVQDQRCRTAT